MQPLRIESLDLELTTRCNLCCPYCYVGIANLAADQIGDMSDQTVEQVFDMIAKFGHSRPFERETRGNTKKKKLVSATKITFYGGEPLLTFDRLQYVVERSRQRGMELQFSALSNGTIGTPEMAEYFKANHIWLQRSIDGCPEAQEKYRPNSIAAYNRASRIFNDWTQSRRMTVQPEFAKLILQSLHYFEEQGFTAGISPMPNYYTNWSDEQIYDFVKQLWRLGEYYLKRWKRGAPFYVYYFSREMAARYMGTRRFGCGGGRGLHCASWDGWLYLCHRFSRESHDSSFCFGSLTDVLADAAKGYGDDVRARTALSDLPGRESTKAWNPECGSCVAQLGCEKGCMHTNYRCTGMLHQPPRLYCAIHQEAAKVVTWLDRELRTIDVNWWARGNSTRGGQKFLQRLQRACP